MSNLINKIKSFTKNMSTNVMDLFNNGPSKTLTVNELISLISTHHNRRQTKQDLLGLVFNTYKITNDTLNITLETKGIHDEQFLEFIVQSRGQNVFSYKGYDQKNLSLKDKMKIPQSIYDILVIRS